MTAAETASTELPGQDWVEEGRGDSASSGDGRLQVLIHPDGFASVALDGGTPVRAPTVRAAGRRLARWYEERAAYMRSALWDRP